MNAHDPNGTDAIIINKPVDNFFGALGVEHMGAFFQDDDEKWYFFFWGNDVKTIYVDDDSIFENLDKMNQWLIDNADLNEENPYCKMIRVEGDFSESVNEAKKLYDDFINNEKHYDFWGWLLLKAGNVVNDKYRLTTRNCSQETMRLFLMGVSENGDSFDELFSEYGYDVTMWPTENFDNLVEFISQLESDMSNSAETANNEPYNSEESNAGSNNSEETNNETHNHSSKRKAFFDRKFEQIYFDLNGGL